MTAQEAKQVLQLYRPDTPDGQDREIALALALARQDAELGRWLEQHCAYQRAMRAKFREIHAPAQLKADILVQSKIIRPQIGWQRPIWLTAAAAAVILLLGLAGLSLRRPSRNEALANFESRMVSTVLREYRMDLVTADMAQVRQFMAQHGAPADYGLPRGLAQLQLTGGGALRWRNNPVSMICFNRGDNQMLYLFVLSRSALKHPPPPTPRLAKVNELITASWTSGDKTYVLAGPEEADFKQKYL